MFTSFTLTIILASLTPHIAFAFPIQDDDTERQWDPFSFTWFVWGGLFGAVYAVRACGYYRGPKSPHQIRSVLYYSLLAIIQLGLSICLYAVDDSTKLPGLYRTLLVGLTVALAVGVLSFVSMTLIALFWSRPATVSQRDERSRLWPEQVSA
ncbi:hypothetical protein BC939DRAFT_460427 [Gamsiella multidivaricata]|uniref:uncharacterized protein n=1 Tax=Gamsiella multidivaricata TaxID=101098 RepID=UPI00221FDFA9|nr:uncharacterized protein BC939DRAFT_460427 [Gamsiella multidivaricata]KAI7819324.1 hypothetical protein BC939DRAFT_460427 [Gamsiella multidivaricata]